MTRKIERIVLVLCLVAAIVLVVFLPVTGFCGTLRFVFLADSRGDSLSNPINTPVLNAIIAQIQALSPQPAFVVFGGDMAYRGYINGAYTFQTWKDLFAPLTSAGIALYTAIGNHELYYQHSDLGFFLGNQQEYQKVFSENPGNGPPGYERLVYSFESPGGDAFFAVLDPYYLTADNPSPTLGGTIDSTQLTWLSSQIANTNATHKFLFIHPPYYYVTSTKPADVSFTNLWTILDDNRFNFYACGHTHLYSRKTIDSSIPPYPQIDPPLPPWQSNVVQLLNGTCGAPVETDTPTVDPTLWHIFQAANTYYFSVVDINGSQVTVTSYSGNTGVYTVFDSFTSVKATVSGFHLPSDQFFVEGIGNLGQFGWGGSDSMPLIWDYDGDPKTDVSIYHIPTNQWLVKGVGNLGQYGWGGDESVPVPGDYNRDGRIERAFYHSPTNRWFVEGQAPVQFGWNGSECIPLPGDYDGDGKTDMVIYHIPSNQWFQYGVGNLGQFGWGGADCIPVPGDYNGDGKTEIAVYHVPTNQWFVKGIGNLGQYGWGGLESFPIPGDYNGDGKMERGFYRSSENRWFIEGESDFVWGWDGANFMPITSQIAVYNWFRFMLGSFQ